MKRGFDEEMNDHQVGWRKANIHSQEWGWQNGKQREWILPRQLWEQGLWEGIRSDSSNSLPDYLRKSKVQKHAGVHNLKSSWMLCANLYFPFGATEGGRSLLAGFLQKYVDQSITSVDGLELEYAEEGDLHPSVLLGEEGGGRGTGQTSPDLAFLVNGNRGLVLVENKFVEHSFYRCSARTTTGSSDRPPNPDPSRCKKSMSVLADPTALCHQAAWGRKYWDHLAPVIDKDKLNALYSCPASHSGYQLFRQQALAEGIAKSGRYDFALSTLAIDARNKTLQKCLSTTGITDIREWGSLFKGGVRFAVFTHQQWVAWVREHDSAGIWAGWEKYIHERYAL